MRELGGPGRIEILLPAGLEGPGEGVAVELPRAAAEHGPIGLAAEHGRSSKIGRRPDLFQVIMGLAQKGRQGGRRVVALQHLGIGGGVGICQVERNDRPPGRILRGRIEHQLDRLQVSRVFGLDALGHGLDQSAVARPVLPGTEIIAVQPDDVGKVLVSAAEIFPIGGAGGQAVVAQRRQPVDRLHRVQKDHDAVLLGKPDHPVETGEVSRIGLGDVVMRVVRPAADVCGEGANAVEGARVVMAGRIAGSRGNDIHPARRVEPVGLAVGKVAFGLLLAQVRDQCLWGIAGDQEGNVVPIDKVASVRADFERVGRHCPGRFLDCLRRKSLETEIGVRAGAPAIRGGQELADARVARLERVIDRLRLLDAVDVDNSLAFADIRPVQPVVRPLPTLG